MTLEGLAWIVVVNGVVQLAGLVILILGQREIARRVRPLASFIYQEEKKTRILLNDFLSRES